MSSIDARITVDRIEGAVAVLVIGDQSVDIPAAALPEGAREGSVLTLALSEVAADDTDAKARLERLRKKNPPKKTFTLDASTLQEGATMYRLLVFVVLMFGFLGAPAWAGSVNVNTASQSELDTLPGIGPSKASAIITYRDENGPFASLSDLDAVPGIGPATLENLAPLVIFSADGQPPVAAAPSADASAPATSGGRININTASQSQLEDLPGIGPSKASAIIDHRDNVGPFASCSGLSAVTGIGDATVANLSSSCATE